MTNSLKTKLVQILVVLPLGFSLFLMGCGGSLNSVNGIDEIESTQPDEGLVEENPNVCLGKVITDSSNLNIRMSPEIEDNICGSVTPGSYITVLDTQHENGFYPVSTDLCSSARQYVFASYVELSQDCEISEPPPRDPPPEDSEPIENLGEHIENTIEKISVFRELIRGGAKGLVEVYKVPGTGENSLCGSKHIRSYRSEPYQGRDTLCAWTAVIQEWRKKFCPDNSPHCRIMVGDQSFGESIPSSWPHSTHRRGWCMDIWPQRDQGCGEKEVTWKKSCYNREATKELVLLLVKHGADKGNQLFFNDPEIPYVRPLANHDDHIHACFKPSNDIVKTRCDSTIVDTNICPEFL